MPSSEHYYYTSMSQHDADLYVGKPVDKFVTIQAHDVGDRVAGVIRFSVSHDTKSGDAANLVAKRTGQHRANLDVWLCDQALAHETLLYEYVSQNDVLFVSPARCSTASSAGLPSPEAADVASDSNAEL